MRRAGSGLPNLSGHDTFPDELSKYARARKDASFLMQRGEEVPAPARERGMTGPNLLNKRMNALCRRAGLPRSTPHQLRHSTTTHLLRVGVPLHITQQLMNRTSPKTTMRSVKAGGQELRAWVATRHA